MIYLMYELLNIVLMIILGNTKLFLRACLTVNLVILVLYTSARSLHDDGGEGREWSDPFILFIYPN